jgi:hypothetical protein
MNIIVSRLEISNKICNLLRTSVLFRSNPNLHEAGVNRSPSREFLPDRVFYTGSKDPIG